MKINLLGKWLLLCSALVMIEQRVYAHTQATLSVVDNSDRAIDRLSVGVTAFVDVRVPSATAQLQEIQGLERASIHGPQLSRTTRIINGKRADLVQYRYAIRFNHAGSFTVGPAVGNDQGVSFTSNAVVVQVVEPSLAADEKQLLTSAQPCYVVIKSDKPSVVVGEYCTVTVKVYYQKNVRLQQVGNPLFEHCSVITGNGSSMQEEVDGHVYYCLEQPYYVAAHTEGQLLIPAVEVMIGVPARQRSWFDPRFSLQTVSSNALAIPVNPLPDKRHVDAVGHITAFDVTLERNEVAVGQTVPITWSIHGDIGVMDAQLPALLLPQGVRYYTGKSTVIDHGSNKYEKRIVGVLQGIQAGAWVLPAQQLTYFDTVQRCYAVHETLEIPVQVIGPSAPATGHEQHLEKTQAQVDSTPTYSQDINDASPDHKLTVPVMEYGWRPLSNRALSWRVFIVLCGLVNGVAMGAWLYIIYRDYRRKYAAYYRTLYAYRNARRQIDHAVQERNIVPMYAIFMHSIAHKLQLPNDYVSITTLPTIFNNRGVASVPEPLINFMLLLERAAFHTITITADEQQYIINHAQSMLTLLHKHI